MLCPPAVLYLIYGGVHIIIDGYKGLYNLVFIETILTLFFTIALQLLCSLGLGIISWIFIAIPFIGMALLTSLLLGALSLHPEQGIIHPVPVKPGYNIPLFYGSLGLSTRPESTQYPPPAPTTNTFEPHMNHNPKLDGIHVDEYGNMSTVDLSTIHPKSKGT